MDTEQLLKILIDTQKALCEHCPSVLPGEPGEHTDQCLAAMEAIEEAGGKIK